jgi:plasmid replication initiation protein
MAKCPLLRSYGIQDTFVFCHFLKFFEDNCCTIAQPNLDQQMTAPDDRPQSTQPPTTSEVLKKPNDFLVMIPKVGKLPMLARKMYNAMLYSTQLQIQEKRRCGIAFDAGTFYTARLTDLVASVTANKSNTIDLVKTYLSDMRKMEVDWRAPDANSPVVWKSMGMLSEVDLIKRDGAYSVAWSFPPTLFEAIRDMRVYTQINQSVVAQLSSYASIALYEICARYKHNPTGHTAKQAPDWWVDALTGTAPKIDKETGLPLKRREWRKFKDASLPEAVEEINRVGDIEIKLVEMKTGKAVTSVQFQVTLKEFDKPKPARNISKTLLAQAAKSDVPLSTISSFLSKGISEDLMMYGLQLLEKRGNASHLESIENKTAYLKAILYDADGRVKVDDREHGVQRPASQQNVTAVLSWEDTRRTEVRHEFLALKKSEQRPYVLGAAAKMKASGMLTATFQRKVDEENWDSGHILAASVDYYAAERHGANWLNDMNAVH